MTQTMSITSRAAELYRNGGIEELSRGVRDFASVRADRGRWTVGAALNSSVPIEVDGHQVELKTDTAIEFRRAKTQMHERQVLEDFVVSLRPTDIVWDCGSNVGLYAVFAAEIATESVAIEPVPSNVSALSCNLFRNDLEEESTVIAAALGASEGTVSVPATSRAGENHQLASSGGSAQVPVKCGDDLAAPEPTVLKMDIEGAEAAALEGLGRTLEDVRLAYIEVHEELLADYGRSADDVMGILEENGFETSVLDERRSKNYHIKATDGSIRTPR